ncbi:unnamed protein product [Tenebrio molitor]|nr:unnamed protein product [Tenebrio molitor]
MEKLQKCVNFILTVPVFFATSCILFTDHNITVSRNSWINSCRCQIWNQSLHTMGR